MDILFLGTSAGVPTKSRNVTGTALLAESGRAWCLVDCGEGTQHRLLHTGLSLHALQAVFVTHVHGDHCYGLPGLLASAGLQGRTRPLPIVAPAGIREWLETTARLSHLTLPYALNHVPTEPLGPWPLDGWTVEATALSHRVPSFAYRFTEVRRQPSLDVERLVADGIPRGPLWGQLLKGFDVHHAGRRLRSGDYVRYAHPPRRIVIAGDNDTPDLLRDACRDAQVLVHEATYTQDIAARPEQAFGHSSAAQVADFAERSGLPHLLLTHFSPRYPPYPDGSPSLEDLRREAAERYRGGLVLAEDFARYRLSRDGHLSRVEPPRPAARSTADGSQPTITPLTRETTSR